MLLFSLAGIPPLAGFFGKFYVFVAAIKAGLFALAVIGVLTSVVGAFYYLSIVKVMYFDEPAGKLDPMRVELRTVLAVAGVFNVLLLRLSGAAGQRGGIRSEVAVPDGIRARSSSPRVRTKLAAFDPTGSTNDRTMGPRARRRAVRCGLSQRNETAGSRTASAVGRSPREPRQFGSRSS